MHGRLLIAGGVVGITAVLFAVGFIANLYTQIRAGGIYIMPDQFVNMIQLLLGASVTCLTLGYMIERKRSTGDEDGSKDSKEDNNHKG